jgi:NAD(P)-dependent dehydrogenase (short-subunit alcohol dehydrogenase family)
MPRRELSGRVVAITGGAGGLGRSLARAFAARGARVAALDLDAAGLARLGADGVLPLACDVTRPEACREAVARVLAHFGALDVLVNNAGISHRSRFEATDPEVIRRVMDVNFTGALNATHAALPALVERRGAIAVVSSVAGFAPLAARSGYAASKHALHGLFDTLRAELAGCGVDVTIACPTFIRTGIERHHLGGDGGAAQGARTVVGKALDPDDVAARIVAAVERRRRIVLVGRVARLAWWMTRLAPGLYARIMSRRMAGELASDEPAHRR